MNNNYKVSVGDMVVTTDPTLVTGEQGDFWVNVTQKGYNSTSTSRMAKGDCTFVVGHGIGGLVVKSSRITRVARFATTGAVVLETGETVSLGRVWKMGETDYALPRSAPLPPAKTNESVGDGNWASILGFKD